LRAHGGKTEPGDHRGEIVAPIEAPCELGEPARRMLAGAGVERRGNWSTVKYREAVDRAS